MPCKIELSDGRVFDESEFYSWLLDRGYDDLIKNNIIAKSTGEPTKPKGEMRKSGFQERSIERGENERVKEIARNNEVYYESVNQKEEYERSKSEYGTYEDVIEKYNRLRLGYSDLDPQLVMDRQVALQTLSIEADRRDAQGLPIADITDKMIEVMNAVSRDAAKAGQMSALTAWRFMRENSIVMAVNRMVSKETEKKLSGLSNEEKAEVDALKEKISELQSLLDSEIQKSAERKQDSKPRQKGLTPEKKARKEELRKKIAQKMFGQLNDITNIARIIFERETVEYAKLVIEDGAVSFSDFSKQIIKDFGQKVKPYLPKLYAEAMGGESVLDNESKKQIEECLTQEFSKAYGKSNIPGARKREVKKDFDKIVEGIENGVLSDDFFRALFLDKFGLKPDMTPEQAAELRRLAKPVARLNPGSKLYNDAVINMAKYIEELYPRNFWSDLVDTWISLAYVNMLSGISTQALNIFSTSTGIVNSPFRNALNLNKWARAFSKGIKEGSLETFKAYSPIYESAYIPQAWAQGSKVGGQLFMETMANGAVTDKYVEELVNTTGKVRINPLERNVYGKGKKFKPIIIGGKDVNPYNFAKYVPRLLSAQDMIMYQTEYETQVVLLALALNREKGLRGKELDNAVNAAISSSYSDLRKAETQVRNEITLFELSGNKVSDRAKAIRISEVLAENMLKKLGASKEQISETKELARAATFTQGTRNGIISMLARLVNRGINKNRFTQLFGKPFVPFVNIVGEVMEFSLDSTPGYGLLRAYGATPSAFIDYMRPKFGLERKGYGANMGQIGSRATDEQLSRAWQGTIVFIAFASMFAGTEEDDPIYLTGGYLEDEKKRKLGNTNVAPKYSIVIKGKPFSYMNIPVINIPLALIGNYNDYLKNHKYDKEDIEKRQALAVLYASFNLLTMVKDMTFLEGVSNLIDGLQDAAKLEGNKLDQAMKTILAQYTAFFGRPLPQNNNMILQIQKFFDPTSYSKKDVSDILAYSVGLQRFNNASLDIFGDPVKNYPSQSMVPYDHWFNLVNKSENWKFLSKFNAIQPKLENDPVKVFNKETDQMEVKKLNSDEFYAFSKLVGSKFKKKVTRYRLLTNTDERVREVVNGKNGVDYDIAKLRTEAKQEAVYELFIKTKLEQKVADSLDELRATEGKIKEKKEKIKARIEKLRLEKSGLTEQDLKVGAAIEDAGRNRIPVFLDIAQQKGYNTFESVKEYAKRFRKAGILSDEDMGEIIRVARAYEN